MRTRSNWQAQQVTHLPAYHQQFVVRILIDLCPHQGEAQRWTNTAITPILKRHLMGHQPDQKSISLYQDDSHQTRKKFHQRRKQSPERKKKSNPCWSGRPHLRRSLPKLTLFSYHPTLDPKVLQTFIRLNELIPCPLNGLSRSNPSKETALSVVRLWQMGMVYHGAELNADKISIRIALVFGWLLKKTITG